MRIVAGRFRGRRLSAPKGMRTRPTTEKVREALFSLLGPVDGFKVADLFAGSGALGLEAMSRGATELIAVDRSAGALTAIKANIRTLDLGPEARTLRRDLAKGFNFLNDLGPFDLILADPPYGKDWFGTLSRRLPPAALARDGRLVLEAEASNQAGGRLREGDGPALGETADRWTVLTRRKYGQTVLFILAPEKT